MPTLAEVKAAIQAQIVAGEPYSIPPSELRTILVDLCDAVEGERAAANVAATATAPLTGADVQAVLDAAAALIAARAPLASPALTGTPTAPTADTAVSSTQIASTAFVQNVVAALVDSSPGALDTLNELAAALGDDPNFATTVTNSLAAKLDLAGGTMTGALTLANDPTGDLEAATRQFVLAQAASAIPTGTVIAWLTGTPPTGTLECDGSAISRTTYATLFGVLGTTYGNGDGSTTFNLPDLRGYFLRGFDNGAGNDPDAASRTDRGDGTTGDNVGTKQADELKSHTHTYGNSADNIGAASGTGVKDAENSNSFTSGATGGNETRPKNVAVMFCIKT